MLYSSSSGTHSACSFLQSTSHSSGRTSERMSPLSLCMYFSSFSYSHRVSFPTISKSHSNTSSGWDDGPQLGSLLSSAERIIQWLVQTWPSALTLACDYEQWTVLHAAARGQATAEVVQYLVSRGASTSALDERGRTPLHLACRKRGNDSVVEYLLRHAAPTLLSEDVVGLTPLFYAARHQSTSVLENLLNEAPRNVPLPQNPFLVDHPGHSLLHYAALDNTPSEITYLAQRFPEMLTLRLRQDSGYTPLHLACHFGAPLENIETLVSLLQEQSRQDRCRRAKIQATWRDLRGHTPLQVAKACPTMDPAVLEFLSNHPMSRSNEEES